MKQVNVDKSVSIYRHYDQYGNLLYVGISKSIIKRTLQHEASSEWFEKVVAITVTRHRTIREAESAEAMAIAIEKPIHNISKYTTRGAKKASEIYLNQEVTTG